MKSQWTGFRSPLGPGIEAFLAQRRALGCRLRTEEMALRLLDRFLLKESIASLDAITPVVIDAFLASRPRHQPRSYNHLLGTVSRVFDWLAARDLAPPSPVRATRRRATRSRLPFLLDADAARQLLRAAGNLPDVDSHTTSSSGLPNYLCVALWLGNARRRSRQTPRRRYRPGAPVAGGAPSK